MPAPQQKASRPNSTQDLHNIITIFFFSGPTIDMHSRSTMAVCLFISYPNGMGRKLNKNKHSAPSLLSIQYKPGEKDMGGRTRRECLLDPRDRSTTRRVILRDRYDHRTRSSTVSKWSCLLHTGRTYCAVCDSISDPFLSCLSLSPSTHTQSVDD